MRDELELELELEEPEEYEREELLLELDDEREYPLDDVPLVVDDELVVLFLAAASVAASYTRRVDCDVAALDDVAVPARKAAIDLEADVVVALDDVVPLDVREYVLREGLE